MITLVIYVNVMIDLGPVNWDSNVIEIKVLNM